MTAKAYLQQIHRGKVRLKHKQLELEEIRTAAAGLKSFDYSADRVQSLPSDQMPLHVGNILEAEAEFQRMFNKYWDLYHVIVGQIEALDDARYSDVLYARYVSWEPLRKIADDMRYDYDYLCRLHGRALKAFEDKYLKVDSE